MLFELRPKGGEIAIGERFVSRPAAALNVKEKLIEDWLAQRPEMLFQDERVLVIGQSVAGQAMADVLALDARGDLVIVEIKRDWSDRATVGQLLEYAASLRQATLERLETIVQGYAKWPGGSLLVRFREFADRPEFPPEQIGIKHRLLIVAPDADQGLASIVGWLAGYGVPIAFVAFSIHADSAGQPRVLEIASAPPAQARLGETSEWRGHWIFNTNESNAPGAWQRMFARGVAAIYGYPNGPQNLEGAAAGERVLAYVNQQGLRAVGTVVDSVVKAGTGIFEDPPGTQAPEEYHLAVRWECVVPPGAALSATQAAALGYRLPVRSVFARLQQGALAAVLERALLERGSAAAVG